MAEAEEGKRKSTRVRKDIIMKVKTDSELMSFLLANLEGRSRNNVKTLLTKQQIAVNGKVETQYNFALKPGFEVKVIGERSSKTSTKPKVAVFKDNFTANGFTIVYEDEYLIVIDKHAGVLSIATESERKHTAYNFLSRHVKTQNPENKIFIVHRLDRETSGLMLFAKSMKVQHIFQENWHEVITERSYLAIVEGNIEEEEGVVESYLHENKSLFVYSDQNPENGKHAITNYKVIKRIDGYTMLEVHLDTGRKNQIRVHMQDLGHCIIGDKKYGATSNPIGRLGLHSRVIAFIHPITKEPMRFQTQIPRRFTRLF